ncbi:heme exporter protein CcmD [Acetobacter papayae]|uniref:heme exporter protein CcmD n=1 Tax=Acetobacter papayae TaxID=1076592 RepID=UPI000472F16A|nr:heme exporter protein CcmD [Acetobacter papayae]
MTHLPYIAASYGLALVLSLTLAFNAAWRLKTARTRLATLERGSLRPVQPATRPETAPHSTDTHTS